MNPIRLNTEEDEVQEQPTQLVAVTPQLRPLMATLSLSPLSSFLPSPNQLLSPNGQLPKQASSTLPLPSRVKISARSSYSPTFSRRKQSSSKSISSATPFASPITLGPRLPSDPSIAGGGRRCTICWFRNDLRLHDNESLTSANNDSLTVLPVFCFDSKDYGKSSSGFDKTGPYRASFVIQAVADLRNTLRQRGSDLIVRIGNPDAILKEIAKKVGAGALYAHGEVSHDEVHSEESVEEAMKEEGIEVKYFWGSTLFHLNDLPFKLEEMPSNYGGFRQQVKAIKIRETFPVPEDIKGLPSMGDIEPGEIPTLLDLGLSRPSAPQGSKGVDSSLIGGETEALRRIQKFAAECQAQPPKKGSHESVYGANVSCKISPWLSIGCISPRFMFDEIKRTTSRTIPSVAAKGAEEKGSSESGINWLMFELLWRDFFRFITRKCTLQREGKRSAASCGATPAFA